MTLFHHLLALGCLLIVDSSIPRKIPYLEKPGIPKPERRFDDYRLWGNQIPLHYNISLNVNVRGHNDAVESTFHGVVIIDFENKEEGATEIEIHSLNLTSDKVSVIKLNGNEYEIGAEVDRVIERKNTVILKLNEALNAGVEYKLKICYNGVAILNNEGLYETRNGENGTVISLVTQGATTHFRQWIPGFDEPSYKATFDLKVTHPSTLKAYSNMPVKGCNICGKTATTEFEKTPLMSPYLLALAVNDYISREGEVNEHKIRVIMRPELEQYLDSSLEKAINASEFVLNLFNLPFMMDKYDFVYALDFSALAMENPGLIVMNENVAIEGKEYETTAHELAHQYFGNLVTCSWWSNSWLNEGFANLYEVDASPDSNKQAAYRRAFLENDFDDLTYPLYAPDATTTEEIDRLFSTVIYLKGGAVLRMIREMIGTETFNTAIKKYLHTFSYFSASHNDLIDMITSEVTEYDPRLFRELLKGWIEQNGYPILLVTRYDDRVEIRQTRFHKGYMDESYRDEISRWSIPVFWKDDNATHTDIFWSHDEVLVLPVSRQNSFVVDPKGIGCYRVLYNNAEIYTSGTDSDLEMVVDASFALKYGYINATVAFSFLLDLPAPDVNVTFDNANILKFSNATAHPVHERLQRFLTKHDEEKSSLRSMALTSLRKTSTYENMNIQRRGFSSKGLHAIRTHPDVCPQKEITKNENPEEIERNWIFYAECYQNDFLNEISDEYLENVIAPALNSVQSEKEKHRSVCA